MKQYEDGMEILWDPIAKRIVVVFRGGTHVLPGRFDDRTAGLLAGEEFCRRLGWQSN
jgi:hypothetical protein